MWEILNLKAEPWPERTPLIEHSGVTGEYVSHFSHFGSLCLQSSPWNCGSRPLPMMNCATVEREVGQIDHSVRCPLWCLGLHQEFSEEGSVRKFLAPRWLRIYARCQLTLSATCPCYAADSESVVKDHGSWYSYSGCQLLPYCTLGPEQCPLY